MWPHVAAEALSVSLNTCSIDWHPHAVRNLSITSRVVRRLSACSAHYTTCVHAETAHVLSAASSADRLKAVTKLQPVAAKDAALLVHWAPSARRATQHWQRAKIGGHAPQSSAREAPLTAVLADGLESEKPDGQTPQNGSTPEHGISLDRSDEVPSSPDLLPLESDLAAALEVNSPAAAYNSYMQLLEAGGFPSDMACERLLKGKPDVQSCRHVHTTPS